MTRWYNAAMPGTITPTVQSILDELRPLGREGYKKILLRHGVREPCYGVKIEDLKKVQKRVKKDHALALALYDTGVYDAMYLAGLIADDAKMTRRDLQRWVARANGPVLCGSTVAAVAAGSPCGREVALEWIESDDDDVASAGWTTLGLIVAVKDDAELDLAELRRLLQRVAKNIHGQGDRARYAMNNFVISVGCCVAPLTEEAIATARKVGKVEVDLGETACQVPDAAAYIEKVRRRGTIGKKRKSTRC